MVCNTLGVWSRSPRHLGGSDPLVCEGPSAHGVERGAPPAAPGVLCGGALGGQSTQATLCYVVTPLEEDHLVYIALELHLPPYHRIGSISVQPRLSKLRLIAQTGIQIVCGPIGELCLCYLNGWELNTAQDERAYDGDFVICWLDQDGESSARIQLADDSLSGLNEEAHVVGNGTENCDPHRVADNRQ